MGRVSVFGKIVQLVVFLMVVPIERFFSSPFNFSVYNCPETVPSNWCYTVNRYLNLPSTLFPDLTFSRRVHRNTHENLWHLKSLEKGELCYYDLLFHHWSRRRWFRCSTDRFSGVFEQAVERWSNSPHYKKDDFLPKTIVSYRISTLRLELKAFWLITRSNFYSLYIDDAQLRFLRIVRNIKPSST